jgi:poly-D-alanine transfer protein DltD
LKYGESSELPCIKDFIQSNTTSETSNSEILPNTTYEPANIRMTKVNSAMVEALNNYVQAADQVRQNMKEKVVMILHMLHFIDSFFSQMKSFSKRPFIKFDLTDDPIRSTEINDLVKKATTIPDIATGPIQAEKKRNEILNAIRLGKRPRDEKFEAECKIYLSIYQSS